MNAEKLQAELDAVYSSTSWKITAPFRWSVHSLKKIMRFLISPERVITRLKKIIGIVLRKIFEQPFLRRLCMSVVTRFPNMREKLKRIMLTSKLDQIESKNIKRIQAQQSKEKVSGQINDWQLTPKAQQLLCEFQSLVKEI